MLPHIHSWNVLTNMVSLSDHHYIHYEIYGIYTNEVYDDYIDNINNVYNENSVNNIHSVNSNDDETDMIRRRTGNMTRNNNNNLTRSDLTRNNLTRTTRIKSDNTCIIGWSWKTLDEENFCSALAWHTPEIANMITSDIIDPNVISQKLKQTLAEAADFAAKKKKRYNKARSIYWWNTHIADIRKKVLIARRKWTKYKEMCNRHNFSENRLLELQEDYKTLK